MDSKYSTTPCMSPSEASELKSPTMAKQELVTTNSQTDATKRSCQNEFTIPARSFRIAAFVVLGSLLTLSLCSGQALFNIIPCGAKARTTNSNFFKTFDNSKSLLDRRQDSGTDVCKRWAGQSALVNGTLYYQGGRSTSDVDQDTNQWNNNFIALDLTKSWQISSPSLTSLPAPSGLPAVSLGYLWSSTDALYLYGGQFSDKPATSPVPFSLWSYEIASNSWSEHQNPKFEDGQSVQRAAEGAGVSIPSLGRGFYFAGHLDGYTTVGWSQSVDRVYLETLLEYTMPGFSNPSLQSADNVGSDGAYRNITTDRAGFPERADGSLIYVPGYGTSGILLGLAGGTNESFTQMNVIDVYDVAESKWYKQATSGSTPEIRVNPCTVAVSAADGSSVQIYMFGGQNLIPYNQQKQYDDMWILTIPAFTWIQVDTGNQAVPPARSGHTCHVWNGQLVVVGGYVGQDLSCDSPGIYVFNTSSLTWGTGYQALEGGDPLNRQISQKDDPNALQGSYGYSVPEAVQKVIGGNALGAATVTAPAQTPTTGPVATGKPHTYTVTGPDGSVITSPTTPGSSGSEGGGGGHKNVGAIVAGVIAGILFLMALYLAFCTWLYRKQLKLYKNHVAMAQREQLSRESRSFIPFAAAARRYSDRNKSSIISSTNEASSSSDNRTGDNSVRNSGMNNNNHNPYFAGNNPYSGGGSAPAADSTDDLMQGQEPSLLGIMLNPRRSLRVVNRD